MSRIDKLVQKLLQFPKTMRFSEVKKILEHYGYEEVRIAGSHHIFQKAGATLINVPTIRGREVKVEYLKAIAADLDLQGASI